LISFSVFLLTEYIQLPFFFKNPSISFFSGFGSLSVCSFYNITSRFLTLFLNCTISGSSCSIFLSRNSTSSGSGLPMSITATKDSKCFFMYSLISRLGSVEIRFLFANLMVKLSTSINPFYLSLFFTK